MGKHYVPDEPDLRTYGYASGEYLCKCTDDNCETLEPFGREPRKGWFLGDKRAWRCQPCALKARDYALSAPAKRKVIAPQIVRDRMRPRDGVREANDNLNRALATMALIAKCHTELSEVANDLTNAAEYGDVLEALMSLAMMNGVSEDDIHTARERKNLLKGRLSNNFWTPDHFMEPTIVDTSAA